MLLLEEAASTMQEEMKSTPLRIVTCIDPGKNRFGIAACWFNIWIDHSSLKE